MATPREFKNRRAYHDYHVLDKIEAGIALIGSEVKSLREGNLSFAESYARIENGEIGAAILLSSVKLAVAAITAAAVSG